MSEIDQLRAEIARLNDVIDKIVEFYPMGGDGSPVYQFGDDYHVALSSEWDHVAIFDNKRDAVFRNSDIPLESVIRSR